MAMGSHDAPDLYKRPVDIVPSLVSLDTPPLQSTVSFSLPHLRSRKSPTEFHSHSTLTMSTSSIDSDRSSTTSSAASASNSQVPYAWFAPLFDRLNHLVIRCKTNLSSIPMDESLSEPPQIPLLHLALDKIQDLFEEACLRLMSGSSDASVTDPAEDANNGRDGEGVESAPSQEAEEGNNGDENDEDRQNSDIHEDNEEDNGGEDNKSWGDMTGLEDAFNTTMSFLRRMDTAMEVLYAKQDAERGKIEDAEYKRDDIINEWDCFAGGNVDLASEGCIAELNQQLEDLEARQHGFTNPSASDMPSTYQVFQALAPTNATPFDRDISNKRDAIEKAAVLRVDLSDLNDEIAWRKKRLDSMSKEYTKLYEWSKDIKHNSCCERVF